MPSFQRSNGTSSNAWTKVFIPRQPGLGDSPNLNQRIEANTSKARSIEKLYKHGSVVCSFY